MELIPQKVTKEKMKADLCHSGYGTRKTPMSWSSCRFDSHMCFFIYMINQGQVF